MSAQPIKSEKIQTSFQYYENPVPALEECVMVVIKRIAEMGVYVELLEYNNMECMIPLSELSRRRIRSIGSLVRVGSEDVAMVIRVSDDNKYFDLSKRRVSIEDVRATKERYNKTKIVTNIMQHIGFRTGAPVQDLLRRIVWPLARQYKHAFDAFDAYKSNLGAILNKKMLPEATEEELDLAMKLVATRFVPDPVKILAKIQISCVAYEGVEAIRSALRAGLETSTKDAPISIQLIAPPLYVVHTTTVDKDKGRKGVEAALEAIQAKITSYGGSFQVETPPTIQSKGHEDEEEYEAEEEDYEDDDDFIDNEAEQEEADKVNFDENKGNSLSDMMGAMTLEPRSTAKKEDAPVVESKKKKDEDEDDDISLDVKKKKKKKKTGFVFDEE